MLGTYELLTGPAGGSFPPMAAAALSGIPEALVKGPLAALKNVQQTMHTPTHGWLFTFAKGALVGRHTSLHGCCPHVGPHSIATAHMWASLYCYCPHCSLYFYVTKLVHRTGSKLEAKKNSILGFSGLKFLKQCPYHATYRDHTVTAPCTVP